MKALGLVVSDKKIFENCILKTYFLTPWPTYASNWNRLNNFDRGPPRDHSCEVWSKSNKRFQRRCCLKKLLTDARTHAYTDGRRTPDIEGSQKLTEHFVLRWAKKIPKKLCKKISNWIKCWITLTRLWDAQKNKTNKINGKYWSSYVQWRKLLLLTAYRW